MPLITPSSAQKFSMGSPHNNSRLTIVRTVSELTSTESSDLYFFLRETLVYEARPDGHKASKITL
jgi:hypothetical protein